MTSPPLPSHLQLHQTDQIRRSLTPDGHAQDKRDLAAGMARMSTSDASPLWILQNADASRFKTTHSTHLKLATLQHSKLQVPSPKTSTPIRTCQKSKTCQAPDSRSLAFKLQASSLKDLNRTFRKTRSSFVFLARYEEDGVEPGTSAGTIRASLWDIFPLHGISGPSFSMRSVTCILRRRYRFLGYHTNCTEMFGTAEGRNIMHGLLELEERFGIRLSRIAAVACHRKASRADILMGFHWVRLNLVLELLFYGGFHVVLLGLII
ncbi:hypothetical protein MVEN_00454600 [Mycena venus]|uniref:Uncharacterized protein n=1 Tax=Mycena venus TaxID=2733690 RepID=A0A8H6YRC4_9AGAR|nr:hypothetical protein MVEN_00454600 [Mycena venus]